MKIPINAINVILFSLLLFNSGSLHSQLELAENIFKNQLNEAIAVGDFDNDGRPDILNSNLMWYRNISDGLYDKGRSVVPINTEIYRHVRSLVVLDFDADGDQDIFAGYFYGSKVIYFENLGDGNFDEEETIVLFSEEESVVEINIIDIDGDEELDLLVLNTNAPDLAWCKNLGDGTFADPVTISIALNSGKDMQTNDVDLDGDPDILTVSKVDNKLRFFENLGEGIFADGIELFSPPAQLKKLNCVDIDSDSDLDLVVSTGSAGLIYSFENLGDGDFDTPDTVYINTIDPLSNLNHDILSFDIDNDGDEDLISKAQDYPLIMFSNLADGTYGAPIEISLDVLISIDLADVIWAYADMNADGYDDLIVNEKNHWRVDWLENNEGIFSEDTVSIPWMDGATEYSIFDYDNDGDEDALIASFIDNTIWLIENMGDGVFGNLQKEIDVEGYIRELLVVDMDEDGKLDVAFAYESGLTTNLGWIRNLGDGDFSEFKFVGTGGNINSLNAIDADSDGDQDLFITLASGFGGYIRWFETEPLSDDPYPVNSIPTLGDDYVGSGRFLDIDEDGDEDFLFVNEILDEYILRYKLNDGDGTFSGSGAVSTEIDADYYIADFDGDGWDDICYENTEGNGIVWIRNLPGTEFGTANTIFGGPEINPVTIYPVDLDEDGAMDIISYYIIGTGDEAEAVIRLIRNSGGGIFEPPVEIFAPDQVVSLGYLKTDFSDMNNDGIKELIIGHLSEYRSDLHWFKNFHPKTNQISGYLFADLNENGIFDDSEPGINTNSVFSSPNDEISISNADGQYMFNLGGLPTTYEISPDAIEYWALTTVPSHTVVVDSIFTNYDSLNFGFFPDTSVHELLVSLDQVQLLCDDTSTLCINIENVGTTIPSGIISLSLDDDLSFLEADFLPDSVVGSIVYWSYDELDYFSNHKIVVSVLTPVTDFEDLVSEVDVAVIEEDELVTTFNDNLTQPFDCFILGNRKTVEPIGFGDAGLIPIETEYLNYTIYFQNTTGDTIENVTITDQIDPHLIPESIELVSTSHSVETIIEDSLVQFNFNDIFLPDSTQDAIESLGFVKFSIPITEDISISSDSIRNNAIILFDGTNTIFTDTTLTTFYDCESFLAELAIPTEIFPIDSICQNSEDIDITGFPIDGEFSGDGIAGDSFDPSIAGIGAHIVSYYFESEFGCTAEVDDTIIVYDCIGLGIEKNILNKNAKIYPNPTSSNVVVSFLDGNGGNNHVEVFDMSGKRVYYRICSSEGELTIQTENMMKGTYLLKIIFPDSNDVHSELLIVL